MLGDSMYLENIDEYVQDENRIVTFKWLSRTLSVPVNAAKRMLYEYVEKEKSSERDPVSVIYLVSGIKDGQDGRLQRQEITLVEDKYLEDAKSQFSCVWTVHIYSVQRSMPKDSESLYTADYQCNKDHLSHYQQWNTIDCLVQERTAVRKPSTHTDRDPPGNSLPAANVVTTQREKERMQSKASRQIFPSSKSSKKKPPSTGDMAAFLSKAKSSTSHSGSLGSSVTQPKSIPVVQPVQEAVVSQKSPSKQARPVTKQSPAKRSKPDKSPSKSVFKLFKGTNVSEKQGGKEEAVSGPTEADPEQKDGDQFKRATAAKSGGPRQRQTKRERSNAGGQSRNEKRGGGGHKRRRVRHTFSDDDDDDESDQDDVEPAEESTARAVACGPEKVGPGGRKRKRVKRLVSKMYMDEDGSMVTEKHWEDVSTDASSEGEKDTDSSTAHHNPSSAATRIASHGSKTATAHHLASKGTKQSSLMSFFGK